MKEELIEKIADQGAHITFYPGGGMSSAGMSKDSYMVSLFGVNLQEFYTREGAEKYRQFVKNLALENIKNTILNVRINEALEKEHDNSEVAIAIQRQKELMKK
jgi:hypothetical protein